MKNLIHKILKEEIQKKNIFIPHRVEERHGEKLRSVYKLLEQEVINHDLDIRNIPIKHLGNVKEVNGDVFLSNLEYINDLSNIKHIRGFLFITNTPIITLKNLKSVKGNLYVENSLLENLGDLEYVGGRFDIEKSIKVTSLGNLRYVGDSMLLRWTKSLTDLGNLEYVGGDMFIKDSGLLYEYTDEEIKKQVKLTNGDIWY